MSISIIHKLRKVSPPSYDFLVKAHSLASILPWNSTTIQKKCGSFRVMIKTLLQKKYLAKDFPHTVPLQVINGAVTSINGLHKGVK